MKQSPGVLAVLSAMEEEIATVVEALSDVTTHVHGGRLFHSGTLQGQRAVVVFSRMGKVAAAATATQLIAAFPVRRLVFSGVAGAVQHGLKIGDVVVASELIQHDMDARPIFPRYEIPLLGKARFAADPELAARLTHAAREFVSADLAQLVERRELEHFEISAPRVVGGLIASGDRFLADTTALETLRRELPDVACVEMEGAAVAQVCDEYRVPFAVVRTLSDSADESSVHDFPRFARGIARHYSAGILARFLQQSD